MELFVLLGLLVALLVLRMASNAPAENADDIYGFGMAADIPYDRPKLVVINDTDINITLFGAESPTAVAALDAGTTGITELEIRADADESGGADIQVLFKVTLTPQIVVATGEVSLLIETVPVEGDASDAATVSSTVPHTETMDAWQTAAGRPRQA